MTKSLRKELMMPLVKIKHPNSKPHRIRTKIPLEAVKQFLVEIRARTLPNNLKKLISLSKAVRTKQT